MRTTASVITDIIEAYAIAGTEFVSFTTIAQMTRLSAAEIEAAFHRMEEFGYAFQIEPEVHRHRLTRDDVRIWRGGEWMHKVRIF